MATVSERMAVPRSGASTHGLFRRFAWAVLGWNLLVVVWGAYVRASGSGAGCGSHWPLCNGEVMPRAPRLETIIEFTHRMMSGVALVAVIALCIWAFRAFPRGHRVRRMATLSVAFLLLEALLGAGLVLFEYVDKNASVGRAIYLSAHLVNTQLLLAVLALTAWFARPRPGGGTLTSRAITYFKIALPLALVVSVTGAIAALGDTLFPATSLSAGFQQDFSDTAHFLLRLRILHPLLAVASGAFLLLAAVAAIRVKTQTAWALAGLVLIQLCAGAMNLALLAPVWMQLIHLLLADLLWIALVLTAVEVGQGSRLVQKK